MPALTQRSSTSCPEAAGTGAVAGAAAPLMSDHCGAKERMSNAAGSVARLSRESTSLSTRTLSVSNVVLAS